VTPCDTNNTNNTNTNNWTIVHWFFQRLIGAFARQSVEDWPEWANNHANVFTVLRDLQQLLQFTGMLGRVIAVAIAYTLFSRWVCLARRRRIFAVGATQLM